MSKNIRICIIAVGVMLACSALFAQSSSQVQSPAATPNAQPADLNKIPARDLGNASTQAGEARPVAEEEEENAQFKYSAVVKAIAGKVGLPKQAVFWIFTVINFVILGAGLVWVVRKALPDGFAPRAAEIQKGIAEARKASAEASARLREIEGRLAKLDAEINQIRTVAEADFSIEEQRIKAAAEQDAKHVIASAVLEIAAAGRIAQRELKSFVGDLAVGLAEKKIKVDDSTDQGLIREFAAQLGKDNQ